jgi:ADP-heptose:LPS heptosyltransferase
MRRVPPATPRRFLIVRLSALGDCIHVLPSLDALRRGLGKDAYIGWLVEERAASLLAGHPQLDKVLVLPRKAATAMLKLREPVQAARRLSSFFAELRRERFDVALDFHSNLRSSIAVLASGARLRYGFGKGHCYERSHLLRNRNVIPSSPRLHKVEKDFELVRALGIDPAGARPVVPISAAARENAARFFAERFPGGARVVAFHPGASAHTAGKVWPTGHYAELARGLAARGVTPVATWGPGERPLVEDIVERARALGATVTAGPETSSLLDLAAVFERCAAVVGADTGPLHLAAAIGTNVVGLYAPKDPLIYGPWCARDGQIAPHIKRDRIEDIRPADVQALLEKVLV